MKWIIYWIIERVFGRHLGFSKIPQVPTHCTTSNNESNKGREYKWKWVKGKDESASQLDGLLWWMGTMSLSYIIAQRTLYMERGNRDSRQEGNLDTVQQHDDLNYKLIKNRKPKQE